MSPVAVSFKLRKFKCNIADKKKLKVKLIDEINVKCNRILSSLGMIDLKLGVKIVGESDYSTNSKSLIPKPNLSIFAPIELSLDGDLGGVFDSDVNKSEA